MNIHERLKQLREDAGLSLQDVSKEIDVSWQTIQQWENGKTAPRRSRLEQVAAFWGKSVNYLMTGIDSEEKPKPSKAPIASTDGFLNTILYAWPKLTPKQKDILAMTAQEMLGEAVPDDKVGWTGKQLKTNSYSTPENLASVSKGVNTPNTHTRGKGNKEFPGKFKTSEIKKDEESSKGAKDN